jgi:FkbM family methyltransferase
MFVNTKSYIKFQYKRFIKNFIRFFFSRFNYEVFFNSSIEIIVSRKLEETLTQFRIADTTLNLEKLANSGFREFLLNNVRYFSQGINVLRVLYLIDFKKDGFFVEFGACDGLLFSNTYFLEKKLSWNGILAEPSRGYGNQIRINRKAIIDNRAVWSKTGEFLEFSEVSANGLSGISSMFRKSAKANKRVSLGLKKYYVETISLNDLLDKHSCPSSFDFLSIDTEGSEFEIIENFNLNKYRPRVITVEYAGDKLIASKLKNLLTQYGYRSREYELGDHGNLWFTLN